MGDSGIDEARARRARLRALLAGDALVVAPGGFSPVYARCAQAAGFDCFFLAGSQMAAYLLGVPDAGVLGLRDVVDHARHVAAQADIPVILDFDTGFGNAINVHYAVQEAVRAGVAAVSIEDQEAPKKSGTGGGRRCVPIAEMVGKLRAAIAARDVLDPSFVVIARCDAMGAEGESFEDVRARCRAYADCGADVVFFNSARTLAQLQTICAESKKPVMTIWGGGQPGPDFDALHATGLRVALYPVLAAAAGLQAAWRVLHDFRTRGVTALAQWREDAIAAPAGFADLAALTGLSMVRELEQAFLPSALQRDYETTSGHDLRLSGEAGPGPSRGGGD